MKILLAWSSGKDSAFAWDGPMFSRPVAIRTGEVVTRDGFVFADLLPERDSSQSTQRTQRS